MTEARVPFGETQESIDPLLKAVADEAQTRLQSFTEALEGLADAQTAVREYDHRTVAIDNPHEGVSAEVINAINARNLVLGQLALQKEPIDESVIRNAPAMTRLLYASGKHDFERSKLGIFLLERAAANKQLPDSQDDGVVVPPKPSYGKGDIQSRFTPELATDVLTHFSETRKALELWLNDEAHSETQLHELARAVRATAAKDMPEIALGAAYTDILELFRNPEAGMRTFLKAEDRQQLLDDGCREDDIKAFEAAVVMETAMQPPASTNREDIANRRALAAMAGAGRFRLVTELARLEIRPDRLPAPVRVVFDAVSVYRAIEKATSPRDAVVSQIQTEVPARLSMIGSNMKRQAMQLLPEIARDVQTKLLQRVAENPGDEVLETQAAALSEHVHEDALRVIESLFLQHLLTRDEYLKLRASSDPAVAEQLAAQKAAEASAAERERIDELLGRLSDLHRPYTYTAKRIRSFAGGTGLIRELQDELTDKQLLHDEHAIQQLAILVLQNEQSEDKATYLAGIEERRPTIRQLLQDLNDMKAGHEFRSDLTSVLTWLDEIIDAGTDTVIQNPRLAQFIYEYCCGPDTPEAVHEEATVDAGVEHKGLTEEQQQARREAAEAYTTALAEILQRIDIQHADVDAFPPGGSEVKRKSRESQTIGALTDIDPQRLTELVGLKERLQAAGWSASLKYTNPTSWCPVPPFILFAHQPDNDARGVCLVENPVNGNASYVFNVDGELIQHWEEVVKMSRPEAVALGAKAFVHPPKGSASFGQHYQLRLQSHMTLLLGAK